MPFGIISSSDARLKNSAAAVVSGIVSQKLYGGSNTIDMDVKKFFWMDTDVTGQTTPDSIDTTTNSWFSDSEFRASTDRNGNLIGKVDKSKYDWTVFSDDDKGEDYTISRVGLQWDVGITDLKVENGKISGSFSRPGLDLNMNIKGDYTEDGKVTIDIDNSLIYGITLEGTIKPNGF